MEELKRPEVQREFFEEYSANLEKPERLPSMKVPQNAIRIQLTIEQAILGGILTILLACVIFFLGIVRGRATKNEPLLFGAPRQSVTHRPAPTTQALPAAPLKAASVLAQNVVAFPSAFDPAKPYTIQLVTYKKKEWAQKEVAALQKAGYNATVVPSGHFYLVCVGQYLNRAEAERDLKRFGAQYKGCYLRRR